MSGCRYHDYVFFAFTNKVHSISCIILGVTVSLEIQSMQTDDNCTSSLAVYDGIDSTAPMLWRGCQSSSPATIRSSSPVVSLVFFSSAGENGASFLLKYTIGMRMRYM